MPTTSAWPRAIGLSTSENGFTLRRERCRRHQTDQTRSGTTTGRVDVSVHPRRHNQRLPLHSRHCSTMLFRRRPLKSRRLDELYRMSPIPRQPRTVACEHCIIANVIYEQFSLSLLSCIMCMCMCVREIKHVYSLSEFYSCIKHNTTNTCTSTSLTVESLVTLLAISVCSNKIPSGRHPRKNRTIVHVYVSRTFTYNNLISYAYKWVRHQHNDSHAVSAFSRLLLHLHYLTSAWVRHNLSLITTYFEPSGISDTEPFSICHQYRTTIQWLMSTIMTRHNFNASSLLLTMLTQHFPILRHIYF